MTDVEANRIFRNILRDAGLLRAQPRYRFWQGKDGSRYIYTVDKVSGDPTTAFKDGRYEAAIFRPVKGTKNLEKVHSELHTRKRDAKTAALAFYKANEAKQ